MADNATPTSTAPVTNSPTPESTENTAPEAEATEGSAAPASAAAQAKEVQKQLKKLNIKFQGKEESVEFDPNDDEFLTKQIQLARLGQTRAQEFAQLKNEVAQFIEALRKDPAKVLADPNVGVDVKQLAAKVVQQEIENAKKSPEQLAKEKLEAELKELKDQREREKQEFQQKELQRLTENAIQTYDQQISEAIESSDLPKSPYVIKKMADYLLLGLQGNTNLTAKDVYPLVREEILDDVKQMFQVMPEEVIEKIVGKDVFTKIRKKNIAKAKAPGNPLAAVKDTGAAKGKETKKEGKKMTFKDYLGV
jgi:hypothetical protein